MLDAGYGMQDGETGFRTDTSFASCFSLEALKNAVEKLLFSLSSQNPCRCNDFLYFKFMQNDVVEASIKGVMPTSNGCAVFLGPENKTFVIYVDQYIGSAISMAINEEKKDRPLTHDLISSIFQGLEVSLQRVIINDVSDSIYFARIILKMENELGSKIVEIDARPSDSMVLAIQSKKPIFVAQKVIDQVDDMTEILERILKEQG